VIQHGWRSTGGANSANPKSIISCSLLGLPPHVCPKKEHSALAPSKLRIGSKMIPHAKGFWTSSPSGVVAGRSSTRPPLVGSHLHSNPPLLSIVTAATVLELLLWEKLVVVVAAVDEMNEESLLQNSPTCVPGEQKSSS
jgi:hypothetical protein